MWARAGRALGRAALWAARLLVDFRATRAGIRRAILAATPLPGQDQAARATESAVAALEAEVLRISDGMTALGTAVTDALETSRERQDALAGQVSALAALIPPEAGRRVTGYATKKAAFLAAYRAHADYGNRAAASRVAAELAPAAGLQAGTARSYAYAELEARAAQNGAPA